MASGHDLAAKLLVASVVKAADGRATVGVGVPGLIGVQNGAHFRVRVVEVTVFHRRESAHIDRAQQTHLIRDVQDGLSVFVQGEPTVHNGGTVGVDELKQLESLQGDPDLSGQIALPQIFLKSTAPKREANQTNRNNAHD
jgi:hypothetical protein